MDAYDQIKEAAFHEEVANIAQAGGLDFLFDKVAEIFDISDEDAELMKSAGALDAIRGFVQGGAKNGVPMMSLGQHLKDMNPFSGMGKSLASSVGEGAKAISSGASSLAGKASKAWNGGAAGGVPTLGIKGHLQEMNPFAGMGKSLGEAGGAFKAAPNFKALAAEGAGAAAAPASRAAVAASAPAAKPLTSRLAVAAAAPAARRGPSMGSLAPAVAGGGGRGYPSPFDH